MNWQQAYILHRYPYQDSSLLLKLWTKEDGLVPAIIKGVRKAKSKTAGLCQPFLPLQVVLFGRGEVKSVRHIDMAGPSIMLRGNQLATGMYINELLMAFLHEHEPLPDLYDIYSSLLNTLSQTLDIEQLRYFECELLEMLGYNLLSDVDQVGEVIEPDGYYDCTPEQLPRRRHDRRGYPGVVLLQLMRKQLTPENYDVAQLFCQCWIKHYTHGKTFVSRQLWTKNS